MTKKKFFRQQFEKVRSWFSYLAYRSETSVEYITFQGFGENLLICVNITVMVHGLRQNRVWLCAFFDKFEALPFKRGCGYARFFDKFE